MFPMAFQNADHTNVPNGMFNEAGQTQHNYNNCTIYSSSPHPNLGPAFYTASCITSTVQQTDGGRQQLQVLASSIDTLLRTLDAEYHAGRLLQAETSVALEKLNTLLNSIWKFVEEAPTKFMKSLSETDDRIKQIEEYYRKLDASIASFQISSLVNIQDWQRQNNEAQLKDQTVLHHRLNALESNQIDLKDMLNAQKCSYEELMVWLQRIVERRLGGHQERRFFSRSLQYLSTLSGHQIQPESWMITSFDVEFGPQIGSGGYAHIFKGKWNRIWVAVKVLKLADGVTPSPESIQREISTWSRLSHPHILQFLGANVLGNKPFIVTPFMDNGNARNYLRKHPECDRLTILFHISLGMVYLHSNSVVHGDLKAENVLIDGSGRALLCDFGLARVKADVMSRSTIQEDVVVVGSRYWIAPEQWMGKPLRKPCDIYSFAMTSYEVYTDEIPLGNVNPGRLCDLVVKQQVRPERPEQAEAPQLTDEVWRIVVHCWDSDPLERPAATTICDDIGAIFDDRKNSRPAPPTELRHAKETSKPSLQNDLHSSSFPPVIAKSRNSKLQDISPEDKKEMVGHMHSVADTHLVLQEPVSRLPLATTTEKDVSEDDSDIIVAPPDPNEIVILVMGPTGVGKSTFINAAAGQNVATVAHNLKPCTTTTEPLTVPCPSKEDPGRRIVFVDTPGFDDTHVEDAEILRRIAFWLAQSYGEKRRITGIIYLHDISQHTRMMGTTRRTIKILHWLCGDDALKNVIIGTTKWSGVERDVGLRRDQQRFEQNWKHLVDKGAQVARFEDTQKSACAIVDLILNRESTEALLIQQELVDLKFSLLETTAGKTLRKQFEDLLIVLKEKARRQKEAQDDQRFRETQRQIRSTLDRLEELKITLRKTTFGKRPFGLRIMSFFSGN